MSKNIIIFSVVILLLIGSFFSGYYFKSKSENANIKDTIYSTIEKIVVKNDSLLKVNDSINFRVIEIERTYEKTVDDIIRNNPVDDYNFFSAYIERYCGDNNFGSIKNCEFDIR